MVLLPEPEGPTIAVVVPALIVKSTLFRTLGVRGGAVGYLKMTF
jgi:hypothetical protein